MSLINAVLKIFAVVCFALLLWVGCASAATLVVNKTPSACTTGDFYCDTIQEAVNMANDDDTIVVCPGTYVENIEVGKSVEICSCNGSSNTIVEAKNTPKNIDEAISAKANYSVFNISANHVKIAGFTIKGGCPAIFLNEVSYCEIINNSLVGIPIYCGGIGVWNSYNNVIINNTIKSCCSAGIILGLSNNNTLTENIISKTSSEGIWMNSSSNNVIRNNLLKSNDNHGVYLLTCYNNIIDENIVSDNEGDGVSLKEGSNNTIRNNTIKSNYCGVSLSLSNSNKIEENAVLENTEIGVDLTESHDNTIKNNEVKSNDKSGIELSNSSNNIIEKNTASDNLEGIELWWGSNNNIINDNVLKSNSVQGIYISSDKNTIERNTVSHNFYGIHVVSWNVNNIIKNNIVNSNSEYGILLTSNSNNNYIEGNIASDNDVGVDLSNSYRNIIRNNIIISNVENGVVLFSSTYNVIENNNISMNRYCGISISQHYENHKETSIENLIYHNNIIDNYFWGPFKGYQPQVETYFYRRLNTWYDPTLLEGNYWSDYKGADDGSGRDKHAIRGDGIGDTEIPHPDFGNDRYPFMNKNGWLALLVSPEYWDFGTVYQGDVKPQQTFEIQNRGKDDLTIFNITSDKDVEISGIELPTTLPAGASKTFTVKIDTKNLEGDILKTLEIVSNDKITPNKMILMYGFVKVYTPGVRVEKTDFESRVIKGQIDLFRISVNNTGVANETNVTVNFTVGDTVLSKEIPELKKNENKTVKFKWDTANASLGIHEIKIEIISNKGESLDSLEISVYVLPATKASTFIVTNLKRMVDKWRNDNISEFEEKLIELSFHPSVNGIIIRVENETNCSKMYEEWDRDKEPEKANEIAKVIKNLIDSKHDVYPNIEYLIIVGDDRIIPFYRIKDNTSKDYIGPAGWWDEAEYGKDINGKSAVGKALSLNYYLTDDFYADFEEEKLPIKLHIPDKPIGRLVETPEEIISTIDTFLTRYAVYPRKIFVTGCEFMSDGSSSAAEIWKGIREPVFMANSSKEVNYNSSEEIKEEILNESNDIMAIFLHANHLIFEIPAGKNVSDPKIYLTSHTISNSSQIEGAIVYAMSCHSGLNVPQEELNSLDLVQSFVKKGVLAYVAPTGYGMGGIVTVAGHEKLLNYFTEHLCEGKEVGESLISAKRDYYLNNFHIDYMDEKVFSSTVLYGLPMYGVVAEKKREEEEKVMAEGTNLKDEIQGMQIEELEIYTLTLRPKLKPEDYSSESGKPILPMATWSYVAGKKKIHGITLKSANYTFTENVSRSIEFFAVSKIDLEWHNKRKNWYPSLFFKLNTIGERQNMVIVTGQFNVTDPWSEDGTYLGDERLFKELTFDIYLSPLDVDEEKPVINEVNRPKDGDTTFVTINATDNSGILKVIVTYTDRNSSNREWVSVEAGEDIQKPNEYYCELKGDVEFFVQAVDIYGNVAVDDYGEKYYP